MILNVYILTDDFVTSKKMNSVTASHKDLFLVVCGKSK